MKIEDLRKDYDELQVKYGAKELDSIYNGGCEKNLFINVKDYMCSIYCDSDVVDFKELSFNGCEL